MDRQEPDGSLPPKGTFNEARWAEILEVAENVLFEKGYKDTTIQEIASRVGLLKGSLYYYIQNKEDLLYQVLIRVNARHLQGLRADPGIGEGNPVSRLSHFIDRHMAQLDRNPPWRGLNEDDHVFLGPDRLASLNGLRHEIQSLLKGIIAAGVEDGTFDQETDPSVAANVILSLLNTTVRWCRPSGQRSFREVGDWYQRFVLKGLLAGGSLEAVANRRTPRRASVSK